MLLPFYRILFLLIAFFQIATLVAQPRVNLYTAARKSLEIAFSCEDPVIPKIDKVLDSDDCSLIGLHDIEKSLLLQRNFSGLIDFIIEKEQYFINANDERRQVSNEYQRRTWCGEIEDYSKRDDLTISMENCMIDKKEQIFNDLLSADLKPVEKDFIRYFYYFTLYQSKQRLDTTYQMPSLRYAKKVFNVENDTLLKPFVEKHSTYLKDVSRVGVGAHIRGGLPIFNDELNEGFSSMPFLNFGFHLSVSRFFVEFSRLESNIRTAKEYSWNGLDFKPSSRFDFNGFNFNFGYRFYLGDRVTIAPMLGKVFAKIQSPPVWTDEDGLTNQARAFTISTFSYGAHIEFDLFNSFSSPVTRTFKNRLKKEAISLVLSYQSTPFNYQDSLIQFSGISNNLSIGILWHFQTLKYINYLEPGKKIQYKGTDF